MEPGPELGARGRWPCAYLEEMHPGQGDSKCKVPEARTCLAFQRSKEAVWLRENETEEMRTDEHFNLSY